jgi:hypothetical protein
VDKFVSLAAVQQVPFGSAQGKLSPGFRPVRNDKVLFLVQLSGRCMQAGEGARPTRAI